MKIINATSVDLSKITETSTYWTSQQAVRESIEQHACRLCHWHYPPGRIWDVGGDAWCELCVIETSREIRLDVKLIPDP